MDVKSVAMDVYGKNNAKLGTMGDDGVIRSDKAVVFRIENGAIYSLHESYLGKLKGEVGRTDRGELLFTLRRP